MDEYPPPLLHVPRVALPVMLSIPHSGRIYPQSIVDRATQGLACLEPLEDPLVDRLAWRGISAGVGAVIQQVPRAIIDCNRAEDETDPSAIRDVGGAPVGPKAKYGLGIIASRTRRHGKLWRQPIERDEFQSRIEIIHRPYHHLIGQSLDKLAIDHGIALLLDLHSMPARPSGNADIVIGDRYGTTASRWITDRAARFIRSKGFTAALNDPYAGGEVVKRHAQPTQGIHALQIEIDRRLYLDVNARRPGPGFDRMAMLIEGLIRDLGDAMVDESLPRAAE